MLFHHTRELEHCIHGTVPAVRLSQLLPEPPCGSGLPCDADDEWHQARLEMEPAYEWLAGEVGFWPLFVAVGPDEDSVRMTGYEDNWSRRIGWSPGTGAVLRGAGEFPDLVCFSYSDLPEPLSFQDYMSWHLALNWRGLPTKGAHVPPFVSLPDRYRRMILKPSWRRSDWLRKARREPHSVQAVVPALDLGRAERIWCRSQRSRSRLIELGFNPAVVEVHRLTVRPW